MPTKDAVTGLVDAALALLVEARRRNEEFTHPPLDSEDNRRLGVAISAAHTVLEPPSMGTPELRAMGLWWED